MDEQVVAPEAPIDPFKPKVHKDQVEQEEILGEKDKEIKNLSNHPGWKQIREHLQGDIDELKTMSAEDLKGLTMEQVGQKFLVASLAADRLQSVLNRVDAIAGTEESG